MPPAKRTPTADNPDTPDRPQDAPAVAATGGDDPRTATEIAADAAREAGVRPIDLPHTRPVADDAPRAEKRGVYVDPDNPLTRVVVAAGDPVPAGLTLESDAPIEDRGANTPTVHPGVGADTGTGTGGDTQGD